MQNKVFVGALGSGKTNRIFKELDELIANQESFYILDSKREYVDKYADLLKENDYQVKIIDLRNLGESETFNPLYLPFKLYKNKKSDLYLDMLESVIHSIIDDNDSIDKFWNNSASDLIMGIILTLFYQGKIEDINFDKVVDIISSHDLNEYFEEYKSTEAYKLANGSINAPRETFGGIKSVVLQKLRLYTTRENLSKFLRTTSFEYEELLEQKSAIIFINYDSTSSYNNLVNAFLCELYMYLENNVKHKFTFVLDNFDSLGYINNFKEMMGAANNYNIDFYIGTRDIEEVNKKYHGLEYIADINVIE